MGSFNSNELEPQVHNSNLLLAQAVEKQIAEDRVDLFQQRAVGDLLPEAEHDCHGESGEHGGAGVPDQRVLRPLGPGIPNQLLLLVSGGPDGAVPLLPVPAPAVVQEETAVLIVDF